MKTRILTATMFLFALAGAAEAQVLWKEGRFGDRITGDIHRVGESDVYVEEVVAGSKMKIKLAPAGRSNYRPLIGMYPPGEDFAPLALQLKPRPPKKQNDPLKAIRTLSYEFSETGKYRLQVLAQANGDAAFAGDYSLRVQMKVNRQFGSNVPIPESGEAEAEFSAHAGGTVNLSIKAGPGADLPTLSEIFDPDGNPLLEGAEVKVKKRSIQVKKLALPAFGVYRIQVSGAPFSSFRYKAKVNPPRTKAEKVDVRDVTPPALPPLILDRTSEKEPNIRIRDGVGGTNRFLFVPWKRNIREYVLDQPAGLEFFTSDDVRDGGWLVEYRRTSTDGTFEAFVSAIARDEDKNVLSFRADVTAPDGPGVSLFSDVVLSPTGEVVGYTERRIFGQEGVDPVYTLVVKEIERLSRPGEVRYTVELSDESGPVGTFVFPPWRMPE